MAGHPLLSVLLTTHTKPLYLEHLLGSLLTFKKPDMEIIVVNDAADESLSNVVRDLFDKHTHSRSYLYEHPEKTGRGTSLNEALYYSQGSIIWAPLRADKLNEDLLSFAINRISKDPAAFWLLDCSLPRDIHGWLKAAEEGTVPDDNRFVWNRSGIPAEQFYFQPAMHQYAGCELAIRLGKKRSWQSTDAFFIAPRDPAPPLDFETLQEILFTHLRSESSSAERNHYLGLLSSLQSDSGSSSEQSGHVLEKVHQVKEDDPRKALTLVNEYLKHHPNHNEALKLKVALLEKLRRHVEASELKHSLQKQKSSSESTSDLTATSDSDSQIYSDERTDARLRASDIRISVIIPTAGYGKKTLEKCLIHIIDKCDPASTEFIIVDNASIDDTFDYLEQLRKEGLLPVRVITNQVNRGFGPSVNQAMQESNGKYILIMHNDLFPEEGCIQTLSAILDKDSAIGVAGPVLDKCDVPEQLMKNIKESDSGYLKVSRIDSCCMLLRKSSGVHFDESYGPAYYEDMDLCNQLAEKGLHTVIATRARALHKHRVTTRSMGLTIEPELEWKNAELYVNKWEALQNDYEANGDSPIDAIRSMELPVNPLNPPASWLQYTDKLLTDETRTEILKNDWDDDFLLALLPILMIADQRDFLRKIENRLDSSVIPPSLLKSLLRYYYNRNIYSRCLHYLHYADPDDPFYDLYKLRIAVDEKEEEQAVQLLNSLMEQFPSHPELYKLTGDIHRANGNEGEAKSFYALAKQLDPGFYKVGEQEFEIKY